MGERVSLPPISCAPSPPLFFAGKTSLTQQLLIIYIMSTTVILPNLIRHIELRHTLALFANLRGSYVNSLNRDCPHPRQPAYGKLPVGGLYGHDLQTVSPHR